MSTPLKDSKDSMERVSLEEAMRRFAEADATNAGKITRLERQINDIVKSFTEHREENANSTKAELQNMTEKIESIQSLSATYLEEATSRSEDKERRWNLMYAEIMNKLDHIAKPAVNPMTKKQNKAKETEKNEVGKQWVPSTEDHQRHTFPTTPFTATAHWGHSFETLPYPSEPEVKRTIAIPTVFPSNGVKHSIIVPPSAAAPAFYGKHSESPTQFLVRVQECAESVHAWDRATLLNGISQFLRESALEWYCQLRLSHRRPQTWTEFTDLFLAQFNSPIRRARQEQEWHKCRQEDNETINEFLVRLRTPWMEQKPKETEVDLIRHLFCKMRNDLLTMIKVSQDTSLDEIIMKAQLAEEILYRRNKEQHRIQDYNQISLQDDMAHDNKLHNNEINRQYKGLQTRRIQNLEKTKIVSLQPTTVDTRNQINTVMRQQNYSYNARRSTKRTQISQSQFGRYWNREKPTDITNNCSTNYTNNYQSNVVRSCFNKGKSYDNKVGDNEYIIQPKSSKTLVIECPKEVLLQTNTPYFIKHDDVAQPLDINQGCRSNLFWPDGTESWYIHEIKPQRKFFQRSVFPNNSELVQHKSVKRLAKLNEELSNSQSNSLSNETVRQINQENNFQSQYVVQLSIDPIRITNNITQNVKKSVQPSLIVISVDKVEENYANKPEIKTTRDRPKIRYACCDSNKKSQFHNLLFTSKRSMRIPLYKQYYNLLSRFVTSLFMHWLLFLCSLLLKIGITHDLANTPCNANPQASIFYLNFIINSTMIKSPRKFLMQSLSHLKTIEILRNLESLLIYALI